MVEPLHTHTNHPNLKVVRMLPWSTLLLAALAAVIFWQSGWQPQLWLDTQRGDELWRFVSGHWVHAQAAHFGWNLAGLLLVGTWLELNDRKLWWGSLLLGSVAVSTWFLLTQPTQIYAGLSGVLNTMLVVALFLQVRVSRQEDDRVSLIGISLFTVGYLLKLTTEGLGWVQWVDTGEWLPAPGAHISGALAGVVLCTALYSRRVNR